MAYRYDEMSNGWIGDDGQFYFDEPTHLDPNYAQRLVPQYNVPTYDIGEDGAPVVLNSQSIYGNVPEVMDLLKNIWSGDWTPYIQKSGALGLSGEVDPYSAAAKVVATTNDPQLAQRFTDAYKPQWDAAKSQWEGYRAYQAPDWFDKIEDLVAGAAMAAPFALGATAGAVGAGAADVGAALGGTDLANMAAALEAGAATPLAGAAAPAAASAAAVDPFLSGIDFSSLGGIDMANAMQGISGAVDGFGLPAGLDFSSLGGADVANGLQGVANAAPASGSFQLSNFLNQLGVPSNVQKALTGFGGDGVGAAASGAAGLLNGVGGSGSGGDSSLWGMLTKALPGLISAYGSSQQGDALREIADRARADRAPYLAKSLEYLNNPQSYADGPGKFALDSTLRALSAQHGNPIGSPTALAIAGDVANRGWQNAVTGFGNLGLAGEDSRMSVEQNAVNTGNIWPALGDSAASVFGTKPDNSLEGLMKKLQAMNQFSLA